MSLEYETPAPSSVSTHDQIYTTLLGVCAFFLLMGIVMLGFLMFAPTTSSDGRWGLMMCVWMEGIYLLAMVVVLVIRIAFPMRRKWPTVGLNLVMLVMVPFGTALGIYGLWKVDKKLGSDDGVAAAV
jgi:hypothetical protein